MPHLLIIKMSSLGDLFHALPAVHALKVGLGASVDWVANEGYADLVRCFADVDRVIPFPRSRLAAGLGAFRRELAQREYDLVIDLQGLLKSAIVARGARTRRRIGPSFQREGARLLYEEVAGPRNKNRHAVEECLDVVRHLGLPLGDLRFPVAFPAFPVGSARPRVALLPCSRQVRKNWPPARFVEVGRALRAEGASLFLIGSPADQPVCAEIARGIAGEITDLCGRTSLVELGGLLQAMDLLVTVDSGPMHMAAAVGTPVVAVFGPTHPERTGPYGQGHVVIKLGDDLAALPAAPVIESARRQLQLRDSA
jgi:heptosyltransferase-1